jgi:hypothetical protein
MTKLAVDRGLLERACDHLDELATRCSSEMLFAKAVSIGHLRHELRALLSAPGAAIEFVPFSSCASCRSPYRCCSNGKCEHPAPET